MGVTRRYRAGGVLGCCLLVVALLWAAEVPRARPPADTRPAAHRNDPLSPLASLPSYPRDRPFDAALREAIEWQQRAVDEAARHQEALKGWDPKADPEDRVGASADWQRQLARDGGGYLRRAAAEAQRAASLARTPHERCRAGALAAALECSLGHHDQELQQARRLVALEPRSQLSLLCLRHAARCNGRTQLEHQATAALIALNSR